jgi:hypothetical protein
VYECAAAGRESECFLVPKLYHYSTKNIGMTRIINGLHHQPAETITITNLLPTDTDYLLDNFMNGNLPKAFDYEEHTHTAKVGFWSVYEMQQALEGLTKEKKSDPGYEWNVWAGRSHRMIVDVCSDIVDAVSLSILSAGSKALNQLTQDHTLYVLFWEDNRTACTHTKIRLLDPSFILFPSGVSPVSNLVSFVGGENRLPKFMKYAIEQFDNLLATKFQWGTYRIFIKLKFNVADHHACFTILRKPGGTSSFRDCFGLINITNCDRLMFAGHSIFSISEMARLVMLAQHHIEVFKYVNPKISDTKLKVYQTRIAIMYGGAWAPPIFLAPGKPRKSNPKQLFPSSTSNTVSAATATRCSLSAPINSTPLIIAPSTSHKYWILPHDLPSEQLPVDPMKTYLTANSRFTPETLKWQTNNELYCCPPVCFHVFSTLLRVFLYFYSFLAQILT